MKISPLSFFSKTLCLLSIIIIFYTDLSLPDVIQISDYTTTFYTAGKLVSAGRIADLYPRSSDTALAGTQFDRFSHEILPHLPAHMSSIFPYPPLLAAMFVPLARLSPNLSLLCFQAITLAALALAAFLLARMEKLRADDLFCMSFLFIPVPIVVWIGQIDLLASCIIFATALLLARRQKFFAAGIISGLCLFKLQLLLVVAFISAWLLLSRRVWQMCAGLALSAAAILLANWLLFGPQTMVSWLNALKLTEVVYLDSSAGVARHLSVSIARFLLWITPEQFLPVAKIAVYGGALALICWCLLVCVRLTKNSTLAAGLSISLIVSSLLLPLVAPHLFYYNLSALVVAGYASFGDSIGGPLSAYLKARLRWLWVIVSCYPLLFFINRSMFVTLAVMLPLLVLFADIMSKMAKSDAIASPSSDAVDDQ